MRPTINTNQPGLSYDIKNGLMGHIAPSVLRVIPRSKGNHVLQARDERDTVLLSVWKTRCNTGRIDIVIWKPWCLDDKRVCLLRGDAATDHLIDRYCVFEEEFEVNKALR